MMLGEAYFVNGVRVRLTYERWEHILDAHPEDFNYHDYQTVLDAVERPEYVVLRGRNGACAAVITRGRFLHIYYRELSAEDGFIITAFYKSSFDERLVVWRRDEQT